MWTQCVEVNAPLLNEHPRFAQAVEQLPIEPLIAELAVKALAIPVLPWAAWRDVGGVGAQALEPIPEDCVRGTGLATSREHIFALPNLELDLAQLGHDLLGF